MNWLKKIFAKKIDERQEMDILKVEHYSFYLMYFLLLIEMIVQGIILDEGDKIIGEWIVFMIVSAFAVIGWISKGVWSYQSRKVPGIRSYIWYSMIAGVVGAIIGYCGGLRWSAGNVPALMANAIVVAGSSFGLAFITFLIIGSIAKRREKKLELDAAEGEEDDEDE